MKITVSEGAFLVARLKRSDPYAEQHILDIVHSIEKGQGIFWMFFTFSILSWNLFVTKFVCGKSKLYL